MSDVLTIADRCSLVVNQPSEVNNVSERNQRADEYVQWNTFSPGKAFRVLAVVEEEVGGLFSSHTQSLPGAYSQGNSMDEALTGLREAVAGCVESYQAHGEDIPWQDPVISPLLECNAAYVGWIDVHV